MAEYIRVCLNPSCPRQGEPFTARRRDNVYCTPSCKATHHKQKQIQATVKTVITNLAESGEIVTRDELERLEKRIDAQGERIDRVIGAMENQTERLAQLTDFFYLWFENQTAGMGSTRRPIERPAPAPMAAADIAPIEVTTASGSGQSAQNFIRSLFALQEATRPQAAATTPAGNPRKIAAPASFAAPTFDDLLL